EIRVLWETDADCSPRNEIVSAEVSVQIPMPDEPLLVSVCGRTVPGEIDSHCSVLIRVAADIHIGIEGNASDSVAKPLAPDARNISSGVRSEEHTSELQSR